MKGQLRKNKIRYFPLRNFRLLYNPEMLQHHCLPALLSVSGRLQEAKNNRKFQTFST